MHWPKWMTIFEAHLRIGLLIVAMAASVALPYVIVRSSANGVLEASDQLVHSARVKATLFELGFDMSELESLVLMELLDVYPGADRPSYADIRKQITPLLDKLTEDTRDNADQQAKIGALRMLLDGRTEALDTALRQIREKNFDSVKGTLNRGAEMYGSRATSWQIVAAEDVLFNERAATMAQTKRISRWAMLTALIAQLLLLGLIAFVSERHVLHRRNAETVARVAVERSRLIVQTMREPVAVLDPALNILMANEAFVEFYGQPAPSAEHAALEDQGDGTWKNPVLLQRLLDVAARGREIWDFELIQASANEIERVVLVNARRMNLSEDARADAKASILLTVIDVTARKRYEQRIQELNDDLEAKIEQVSEVNRELESFSYSVSHDLRAPLRHIAGFSEKLGAHIGDSADDKSRHYLDVIGDAARRMAVLIEDLLEYSRLGRSAFHVGPVNMSALVAEVSTMFQSSNEDRLIDWKIDALPIVIGDESMLRRVWQNLISNAVKYTGKRERAMIEIGLGASEGAETVFYVRDNGTGFDMAYAGKLFGVFQRLHKPSDFPGTGIGLANVRRIISRHGGRTWAESEPDKGTSVFFSLPSAIDGLQASRNPA